MGDVFVCCVFNCMHRDHDVAFSRIIQSRSHFMSHPRHFDNIRHVHSRRQDGSGFRFVGVVSHIHEQMRHCTNFSIRILP